MSSTSAGSGVGDGGTDDDEGVGGSVGFAVGVAVGGNHWVGVAAGGSVGWDAGATHDTRKSTKVILNRKTIR
jgi:hypothetical protein